MQADEVLQWQIWITQEPRGMRRHDYQAAQITHAIYTILQSFSGNDRKLSLEDNLLRFEPSNAKEYNDKQNVKNAMVMAQMFAVTKHGGSIKKLNEDLKLHYSKNSEELDSKNNSKE